MFLSGFEQAFVRMSTIGGGESGATKSDPIKQTDDPKIRKNVIWSLTFIFRQPEPKRLQIDMKPRNQQNKKVVSCEYYYINPLIPESNSRPFVYDVLHLLQ